MINDKKVAVLLATYQGEKYIKQQLNSLLSQTYKNWRAFIHDDGSKDNTVGIIKEYCKKYPDFFTIIEDAGCGGAKENFFFLTRMVESELYMYCDQDDVWKPDKIQLTFDEMEKRVQKDKPCLIFTDLVVVDSSLKVIDNSMSHYQRIECEKNSFNRALIQNVVTGCTMMINRSLRDLMVKKCNYKNVLMHDWWAALIANAFGEIHYINTATILYRQHLDNSVGAKKTFSVENMKGILKNQQKVKDALKGTRIQALEFYKVFGIKISKEYGDLDKKKKINRIIFYYKNRVLKSSLIRNIGLIIWG